MTQVPSAGKSYQGEERRRDIDHDEYFNARFAEKPVYVGPGEHKFSNTAEEMLIATVGSGVVVSIFEKDLRMGGMAYVLIPEKLVEAFPFFDKANPALLNAAFQPIMDCIGEMKRNGAGKNRIRIRLMGGTSMPDDEEDRGTKNYIFVHEYLTRQGLQVMSEDTAGGYIRRVHFFPASGRAVRRVLRRKEDYRTMKEIESEFQSKTST